MKEDLTDLLKDNVDLFIRSLKEMLEIDLKVICQNLMINPKVKTVVQKKRRKQLLRTQSYFV